MKSKQVIVIRKDLNMRKGKMVAQGSHASMKAILELMYRSSVSESGEKGEILVLPIIESTAVTDWLNGTFTKICVSVDSEQELTDIYSQALKLGMPCSLIKDAGLTEFDGVPTLTCCAIGPAWDFDVNKITGHLKLL